MNVIRDVRLKESDGGVWRFWYARRNRVGNAARARLVLPNKARIEVSMHLVHYLGLAARRIGWLSEFFCSPRCRCPKWDNTAWGTCLTFAFIKDSLARRRACDHMHSHQVFACRLIRCNTSSLNTKQPTQPTEYTKRTINSCSLQGRREKNSTKSDRANTVSSRQCTMPLL